MEDKLKINQTTFFDKYPAYKDSGVPWLGEIPAHWEILKLGNLLSPVSVKNEPNLPLLSITREKGVILRDLDNEEENHNFIPDDLSNYKLLREGQFGMNKMKAWQGSYGVSDFTGIVSPAYYVFNLEEKVEPRFFHKAIRSSSYISFFGAASDGVRIGQWDLSKERMKQIPFLIPPKHEQTAIATFLDRKTTQIDQAISQKERMIELLKERRQILIQNAVTRGLNPNVKMKDSGVEWIGEIPEHWEVKRIKYLGKIMNGYAFDSSKFKTEGTRVIKIANIQTMRIDWTEESYIDDKYYNLLPQFRINKGDLVFALTRPIISTGIKAAIVESEEKILLNQRNAVLKPLLKVDKSWLYYIILDQMFTQSFDKMIDITGQQPNISTISIGNLQIPYTAIEEQRLIITFLNKVTIKISQAIFHKEKEIEKLKEYKSTLINSAVTGKIKVC
ncbi:restriction endonuclease subunit S [Candidatus Nomurabacteria bacterium]|nr:restriction endonuclease subunit S [Candidatus Nomurabacteria bacterium]